MSDNNKHLQKAVVFIANDENNSPILHILEAIGFACEIVVDQYQLETACKIQPPHLIYIHDSNDHYIAMMASLRQTLIPNTPILFGVEQVNATLRDRIAMLGLADYVIKPVQYDEFLHRIQSLSHSIKPSTSNPISLHNSSIHLSTIYEIGRQLAETLDENEIFRLIYAHLARGMFQSSSMIVSAFDPETQMIRCVFAIVNNHEHNPAEFPPLPLGDGPNSEAIRTRQIQIVDLDEVRRQLEEIGQGFHIDVDPPPASAVYIPLVARNRIIGVLNIQHYEPYAFDDVDKNLLTVIANQAATALENAGLYKRVKRQVQELEALYRSTGFYKIDRDLKDAAMQIAEAVVREFSHVDCGVMIVEDNSGSIIRLGRAGAYQPVTKTTLYLDGPGLVPEAIRTARVIYAPDVSSDPRYIASDSRTRSELAVPLPTYEKIIGVLDLQSTEPNAFSQSDIRIIQAFAERAAAVIEDVILYNQTINYAAELVDRVKERTKEYREALGLFEAIFNGSSDAVFVLDLQGEIQQANRIACELFQIKSLPGYPQFVSLFDVQGAETIRKVLDDVMALNRPLRKEVMALCPDGRTFPTDAALYPIFNSESNDVLGVVCSLRDITERKKHEARLKVALNRERELNELRARFVTTVSHGFRTPMARILSSSEMLSKYIERMEPAQLHKRLTHIDKAIHEMTRLMDNLLIVSHALQGHLTLQPQSSDITHITRQTIQTVLGLVDEARDIALEVDGDCTEIMLDADLYQRAITELLLNALLFSPPDATVTCQLLCTSDQLDVWIKNAETTINDYDKGKLFDLFYRGQNAEHVSGTGLGLSLARLAIELQGGEVTLENLPDFSVQAHIRLPLPVKSQGDDQ